MFPCMNLGEEGTQYSDHSICISLSQSEYFSCLRAIFVNCSCLFLIFLLDFWSSVLHFLNNLHGYLGILALCDVCCDYASSLSLFMVCVLLSHEFLIFIYSNVFIFYLPLNFDPQVESFPYIKVLKQNSPTFPASTCMVLMFTLRSLTRGNGVRYGSIISALLIKKSISNPKT